ncbi:extracellular solute-binding protein [Streptomyces sp. BPTC-684]|uniref:ABC transporter substrate-binding protein n=1 Tax=Streptomyces sp. BPTC-684 TaxID=3043734 RepID=UPI0024B22C08|nr:extracellular solute-binding protein [Streptomyces sp. BPTC-684]WHM40744.1 extracellular solute-binding protein [Streptomyces sp. BPTC-684]
MTSGRTWRVTTAAAAPALVLALAATGCGGSSGSASGKVTVRISTFSNMGFNKSGLFEEYEKLHPNITIKEDNAADETTYWQALQPKLSSGQGLGDIVSIEVGRIRTIAGKKAGMFTDLSHAPGVQPGSFYPWKWAQAKTEDGKVLGLGTDIGPMAVCYRKDLFQQAGLPTDRTAVGALWAGDWAKYVEVGERFQKQTKDKSLRFMDTGNGLYNAMIFGQITSYYDASGRLVHDSNPGVRRAYDLAARANTSGMTAKLQQFQANWRKSFSAAKFATVVCPSWMLGQISQNSGPSGEGKWDIAKAPAPSNWGGSFLTVPKNSKVKDEAEKLAAWLTAPAQQAKVFASATAGNFPSSRTTAADPAVAGTRNPYFTNAPVGQIFGDAAKSMPTLNIGPDQGIITNAISTGLTRVEQQGMDPDKSWRQAMSEIKSAIGKD